MKKLLAIALMSATFVGCASVQTIDAQHANLVQTLTTPESGKAVIFVYREKSLKGAALKKDLWVNGQCLGESARGVYFFKQVDGGQSHVVSTESEFSPNHLRVQTEAGKKYYVKQFIKMGAFVGGAGLEQVSESEGASQVAELQPAKTGACSKPVIKVPA